MNMLDNSIKNAHLSVLDNTDLRSINGGDKLSEDVFRVAGYIWQTIKNIGDAYVEGAMEARIKDGID